MAVTVDDLMTPLADDGSEVREDLFQIADFLGLYIPRSPGEPGYQLVDTLARWATRLWNGRVIPAIRAQFGRTASGDWATLFWRGRGVDRGEATFASVPVTFENRSTTFFDVSGPGAVQITSPAGVTFTSQGPAPGFVGTLGIWPGGSANYPTTTLVMQADVIGSAGNVLPNAFAGYPAALGSGPPGVYVGNGVFGAPAVTHGAARGSDGETDGQLLERGRATVALGAPIPVLLKMRAIVLSTKLAGDVPVATSRIRVIAGAAVATVYCATPSGPTPGDLVTAGTELFAIDARLQLYCATPGLTLITAAATAHTFGAGIITIYLDPTAGVSIPVATATAQAAIDDWISKIPIGGVRSVAGGQGYVFSEQLAEIAGSRLQAQSTWTRGATYLAGATVTANGGAYWTPTGGTSATTGSGPTGTLPGADGTVVWVYQGPASGGYVKAPGVIRVKLETFVDAPVAVNEVALLSYTLNVQPVSQG